MNTTSKRTKILLFLLALPAYSQATSPPTPKPDNTAEVTRTVYKFFDSQQDIICVKRPSPRPDYEPGRLQVSLFSPKLNFAADLETRPYQTGQECVKILLPNNLVDKYKLEIIDMTRRQPWHQFFVGRLMDIAAGSKAAP
jgi:hypothetical protein